MSPHVSRIPVIAVGEGLVPYPGVSLRIPLGDRPDLITQITYLLKNEQGQRSSHGLTLGVIPVQASSENLSSGKNEKPRLRKIESGRRSERDFSRTDGNRRMPNPVDVSSAELYTYGTTVKIRAIAVDSVGSTRAQMLVEGMHKFQVVRFLERDPYPSAEVSFISDLPLELPNPSFDSAFSDLRLASRKLVMMARASSLLPKRQPISFQLGRQIDSFIANVPIAHAGLLADFMMNIIDASHEEKLEHLADSDVLSRVHRAHKLIMREIDVYENNQNSNEGNNVQTITFTRFGNQPFNDTLFPSSRPQPVRVFSAGLPNMPGGNNPEETSELEELKRRLDNAGLPAEAAKIVGNELQRLSKMSPSQTEYHVCRNYLEVMADVPWSKVTADKLDRGTLTRAQTQLDADHAGLDHVKRRLIEYLAVLRLKQDVQTQLDLQVENLKRKLDAERTADTRGLPSSDVAATQDSAGGSRESPSAAITSIRTQITALEARKNAGRAPILLLVGPPGTGKTSLARSIATALGRSFQRISLGGVRDEAEIRGHRRTYVAAMPGMVVAGLRKAGVANPVMLLDEIDKLAMSNYHGDPSAALLEVLDPEQNHAFLDHYLSVPVDLSRILFIATANSLDTIPAPLLDRMETITLSGYTPLEKRDIAVRHLLPKQIMANGLTPEQLQLDEGVVDKIITGYTREAGVRNLERTLGAVCRAKAVEYARALDSQSGQSDGTASAGSSSASESSWPRSDSSGSSSPSPSDQGASTPSASLPPSYNPHVRIADLEPILGIERFDDELASKTARPGVVTGLVAFSSGAQGGILFIEVADMPGSGSVTLTGTLGDILKESVTVALSWVRAHAFALGLVADPETDLMRTRNIHVHCPAGAIPKDGPSAGLAHTLALVSLFSARPIDPSIAMTGEVSLRGRVLPVGGIKEKLIGALRAGVKTVILPAENRKDVADLPDEVRSGIRIVHVAHVWEALQVVWPDAEWKGWEDSRL